MGPVTFRVRASRAQSGAIAGLILGAAVGKLAGFGPQELGICCGVGLFAGLALGKLRASDFCADPSCGGPLDATMTECPKCHRSIAGVIDDATERLDAERKLRSGKKP